MSKTKGKFLTDLFAKAVSRVLKSISAEDKEERI